MYDYRNLVCDFEECQTTLSIQIPVKPLFFNATPETKPCYLTEQSTFLPLLTSLSDREQSKGKQPLNSVIMPAF